MTPTVKLTDLQARVLGAVTPEWTPTQDVGKACGWGLRGCRRDSHQLALVMSALERKGLIEVQRGASVFLDVVRLKGGGGA